MDMTTFLLLGSSFSYLYGGLELFVLFLELFSVSEAPWDREAGREHSFGTLNPSNDLENCKLDFRVQLRNNTKKSPPNYKA